MSVETSSSSARGITPGVEILSPLTLSECIHRLRGACDPPMSFDGQKAFIARLDDRSAFLRRRISYRNDFQTELRVRFEDAGGGARMICQYGLRPETLVFLLVWAGLLIFGLIRTVIAAITDWQGASQIVLIFVLGVFLLLSTIFGIAGQAVARGEAALLIDFLARTTAGEVKPDPR